MRHSFLPNNEQAILKRRYRIRLAVVALFLLSVVGLIGVGSFYPAYIYVYTEEQEQTKISTLLKKDQNTISIASLKDQLQSDTDKIRILLTESTGSTASDLVERIIVARGQVLITSIVFNNIGTSTATITLDGVAPTRESLVSLKTRLQSLSAGNKVDLPISGFAKSKDIPFSLKLIYKFP